MSVIYSFIPNIISLDSTWHQHSISITNDGTEYTELSKYIPDLSFYNKIKDYFSGSLDLTTINLKGFTTDPGSLNRVTGVSLGTDHRGEITQDFELYAFQNKEDNNFYFYFYCNSYLTAKGEPAGVGVNLILLNEKQGFIYPLNLYGDTNQYQFMNIYTINKNLTILKMGTAGDPGYNVMIINNKDIFEYQGEDLFFVSNDILPGIGTQVYTRYSVGTATNYVSMVPLKCVDYFLKTEPKEVYIEAYGNKANEIFRKNGVDYLCFGRKDSRVLSIIISSKALNLE